MNIQVLETFLHLRINPTDIQSLKQNKEKKSAVALKIEKNKNKMEKKLKGKMSKKEKKVRYKQSFARNCCLVPPPDFAQKQNPKKASW